MQLGQGINAVIESYRDDFFDQSVTLVGYSAIIRRYSLSLDI